jgi:purine-binding chemotaxis protein CheW
MIEEVQQIEENKSFLVFKLGQELYGTPLLDVREVSEYQKPKPVPHSAKYFSGVINIRGEILATLDLRSKYNFETKFDRTTTLLVFETTAGNIAVIVDSLLAVVEFEEGQVDQGSHIDMGFPQEAFMGIGKLKEGLVTLLDLRQILQKDSIVRHQDFKKVS